MPLSREQAEGALRDITQTERRSSSAYGYKSAAPYLILWGILWIIGYGATDLTPHISGAVWGGVTIVGSVASALVGMRRGGVKRSFSWRIFFSWIAAIFFICAIFTVLKPSDGAQVGAVIPLLVACSYVIMGIWMGTRLAVAGIVIAALTLFGFFFIPAHFALWMAAIGGAALIGTGLWLRSV